MEPPKPPQLLVRGHHSFGPGRHKLPQPVCLDCSIGKILIAFEPHGVLLSKGIVGIDGREVRVAADPQDGRVDRVPFPVVDRDEGLGPATSEGDERRQIRLDHKGRIQEEEFRIGPATVLKELELVLGDTHFGAPSMVLSHDDLFDRLLKATFPIGQARQAKRLWTVPLEHAAKPLDIVVWKALADLQAHKFQAGIGHGASILSALQPLDFRPMSPHNSQPNRIRTGNTGRLLSVWLDPWLLLFCVAEVVLSPALLANKLQRRFHGKKRYEFDRLRWSCKSPSPEATRAWLDVDGPKVVFAGVSFGELQIMEQAARKLAAVRPEVAVAFCVRDPVSRGDMARRSPPVPILPWPYENPISISTWIETYDPDLVVFTQSFRNRPLAVALKRWGAKVALLDGIVHPRKTLGHRVGIGLYRHIFRSFDLILVQNQSSLEAASPFVGESSKLVLAGDMKFDVSMEAPDAEKLSSLKGWLGDKIPIVAAGSTESEAEELMVLRALEIVRKKHGARLLIAPRKVARGPRIAELAAELGLSASLRSSGASGADVCVLDTLGELRTAYALCRGAYVGGSFDGHGHNILEPLMHGVPTCYGMRRGHFGQMQIACEREGLGNRVQGSVDLQAFWVKCLNEPDMASNTKGKVEALLARERGATARSVQELLALL